MMIWHSLFSLSGKILFTLGFLLFFYAARSQEKCGTVAYEVLLKNKNALQEDKPDFEAWLQSGIDHKRKLRQNLIATLSQDEEEEVFTIPVVVHIIHNGENIGQGANLSIERVLSQIETLNKDFRRLNADTVNTPALFLNTARDTRIEFVLAKRDPEGLPTEGIIRKKGNQSAYELSDNWILKSNSYWPAEDYLNIWVAPLSNNLMGFAQFPQSNTAPGLEDASANRLTDGVVISHEYFGENNNITPHSKGRTATHEIGHFLGLRHIWGDGGCEQDDFCEDTPSADSPNYGCPTGNVTSCGNLNMYQNYMDYTDDNCMNIFTFNQMERMHVILQNSPRRASLLSSKGGLAPEMVANDLGIKKVIAPTVITCDNAIIPEVLLKNYGTNDISNFKVLFIVNEDTINTLSQSIDLLPLDSIKISFPTFVLADTNAFVFSFYIKEVNSTIDENEDNNKKEIAFTLPQKVSLPLLEEFENPSITGTIFDPDRRIGWEIAPAPNANALNKALKLNCFNYSADAGEQDYFFTDVFDLTNYKSATLKFSIAYAQYSRSSKEGFKVSISTNCGLSFQEEDVLFKKHGSELATARRRTTPFTPDGRLEWKEVTIDLNPYLGETNLRIAFVGINDYGNNMYLDNINVIGETESVQDLKILKIDIPPVACDVPIEPKVYVLNKGLTPITTFKTTASSSVWAKDVNIVYNGPVLQPNDTATIALPLFNAAIGSHNLSVQVAHVGGITDHTPEDNFRTSHFVIDTTYETLPFREQFSLEEDDALPWFIHNPDNNITWELLTSAGDQAIHLNHYAYTAINEKDWLVSPLLNLTDYDFLRLSFKISYGHNYNYRDQLQVLVSTDCGLTYTDIVYNAAGEALSSNYASSEWLPEDKTNWQNISVSLDKFVGEENVRVAFVTNNGHGNNLYLDDIEFFVSEEPQEPLPEDKLFIFPNPIKGVLPITFGLNDKEFVQITLYDLRGKLLYKGDFPGTLNQLYYIDFSTLPDAVYLLKVSGESFSDTKKILLQY